MRERLEVIKKKWKLSNKPKKIGVLLGSIVGIIFIVSAILKICTEVRELWRNNSNIILSLFILLIYLYPFLYSFFSEIRKKDKEIVKILKKDNNEEIKRELQVFDYYTLPRFIADVSKQFSSLWIFIFVQVLFIEVPELITENSIAMMQAYWGIIQISLLICFSSFILCKSFSMAIIATSLTQNRHADYILKIRDHLIKKADKEN